MNYIGKYITKNPQLPSPTAAPGIWNLDDALQYQKAGIWPPGYPISRSVRLRSSASAYFNRTFTTPTNAAKWTFNRWVKRGTIGARQSLFAAGASGTSYANIEFKSDDTIQLLSENSAVQFQLVTTQVFRDPSAWYNIHIIYDSANATSTDRIQLWINGVRVTAFSTATYPDRKSVV